MEDVFVLPASSTQQRLWFLDRFSQAGAAYNVFAAFTLRGPLQPALLEQSLNIVAARHESLRTAFTSADGVVSQIVQPAIHIPLEIAPWPQGASDPASGHASDPASDPALDARLNEEAAVRFKLSEAPLVRAKLFVIDPQTHVFFVACHHIMLDGWGQRLLFEETAAAYNALAAGREPSLPPLALQFGDFAIWEQESLKANAYEAGLAFWTEQLAGDLPVLDLPRDHPRPLEQTYRGRTLDFTLAPDVTQRLVDLARSERGSLFAVILSAFAALLYRYTGQTDVIIGSPIANRLRAEVEGTIGFFANTVVFRNDVSGRPTFRELLARVRQTANNVYAYQDVPFDSVVNAVLPNRTASQNPMFQVMLAAQRVPDALLALDGIDVQPRLLDNGTAKFDLLLELQERASGTDLRLEYSTDLFEPATAERIRSHLLTLLAGIADSADVRIDEYALMSPEERRLVVETFNDTKADYPDVLLHDLIEAQAARTPKAIALECEGRTMTFEALDRESNQLAHYLRDAGVAKNQFVAVCLERSLDLIVALVGTLKAGGAYVPLDPDYPVERLRFMVRDANAPVLITTAALAERIGLQAARVLMIDRDTAWRQGPASKPDAALTPGDLAYMIYTSGSTGQPKGARNAHRGIVNRLFWMRDKFGVDERTIMVQKTPISFDVSVPELFMPLVSGARMVLARPGGHRDPAYMLELLETCGATMVHFVPSMLRVFLDQSDLHRAHKLQHVFCSGEALPTDLRELFYRHFPISCGLHNLYGPTEAAVEVTHWDARSPCDTPTVPIGTPLTNTRIYILDALGAPTPLGVPGELYIAGVQVGQGYHERPDLTAERFVQDPFSSSPDARLYKTGDLCRFLPNGAIEFLGRLDHQVKLRGFRVELGEIESTLKSHESVRDVVLTALDDPEHGQRLVAYIVARQDGDETSQGETLRTEHVNEWEGVWDQIYTQRTQPEDPRFNIIGWNSNYTQEPLPEAEMREWVERTVSRIGALEPRRVWEIGCGTGLLLFRLAERCETYLGTDHSVTVLQSLAPHVANMTQVHLRHAAAHEAPVDSLQYRHGQFDTVILNSVSQYFPSADYLLSVIDTGVAALRDGGSFYLGDIRNLVLLETFHTSVQLFQAPDDLPVTALRERVQRAIGQEQELVLHPEFFTALPRRNPRITSVEIHVKNARSDNELTRFRYDVILKVGGAPQAEAVFAPALTGSADEAALLRWMTEVDAGADRAPVRMRDVPNLRLLPHHQAVELMQSSDAPATVGELKRAVARRALAGIDPARLWNAAATFRRTVEISPSASGRSETVDVTLGAPKGAAGDTLPVDAAATQAQSQSHHHTPKKLLDVNYWRQRANNPLQASYARRLLPQLRAYLSDRLPEYMVPSAFVFLERIQLLPNGKVDRRALPPPDPPVNRTMLLPPRDDIEERLVAIWSEVLGVRNVSRTDNFFDLGGHSLIAAKLLTQMNKAFNTRLQLPVLFEESTIEGVARVIRGGSLAPRGRCIVALSPSGSAPPLFFVHPLGGGVTEYLPLAKFVAPDQPLYGLHVPLEDGVPAWADTIESMAGRYADEIVQQCPDGPILLGGWSGGAVVALEIAQQLRARRRDVPLVIALDASPYNTSTATPKTSPLYAWKLLMNFPHWVRDDALLNGTADVWNRVKRKIKSFRDQGKATTAETSFSAEVGGFFDLSRVSDEHRSFMERYYVALWRYVAKPYEGAVLLVKARTQPLYHLIEPEKAWPPITKDLDVHVMPCTHLSIVREPHVRDVAALIKSKVAAISSRYASNTAAAGRAESGTGAMETAAPAETSPVSS